MNYFFHLCFIVTLYTLSVPLSMLVYLLAWKWYGVEVYGAIYQRGELGKWP